MNEILNSAIQRLQLARDNHTKPILSHDEICALLSHTAPQAESKQQFDPLAVRALAKEFRENPREASLTEQAMLRQAATDPIASASPVSAPAVSERDELRELLATLMHFIPKGEPQLYFDTEAACAALNRPAPDAAPVQDGEAAKRLSDLNFRKRELETEVSDLRNTLAALRIQLSTARAEGYAEAIEAAKQACQDQITGDEDKQDLDAGDRACLACANAIDALQYPTQGEQG